MPRSSSYLAPVIRYRCSRSDLYSDARGVFYPGVFQFSLELSRYRLPAWQEPLSVAVLTARARELLFALEIGDSHQISREFRTCGERNGMKPWGRGPVLYGSIKEWICTGRKSARKARNFGKLVKDDGQGGRGRPSGAEGGYIFIGDTGEGDPRAGEMMSMAYPERLRAVFLHVVSDAARQDRVSVPADRLVNGVPVVYFRTYVGAAAKAVELGLMDKSGLENVITAAQQVSVGCWWRMSGLDHAQIVKRAQSRTTVNYHKQYWERKSK